MHQKKGSKEDVFNCQKWQKVRWAIVMSKCDDEKSDLSDDLEDEILTMKMKLSVLSLRLDEVAAMQIHIEEWLYTLHRDDIMSSILLLH